MWLGGSGFSREKRQEIHCICCEQAVASRLKPLLPELAEQYYG